MKKVVITGPLGQDGKILTELLENEYELYGICRVSTTEKIIQNHEKNFKIKLKCCNLNNFKKINELIGQIKPNVIINFAGKTDVISPWMNLESTFKENFEIPLNLLKSIEKNNLDCYFFQSSSSLMYGRSIENKINEKSSFAPLHPYGISKLASHNLLTEFRYKYGIKCCSGIFFNHESFYRNDKFISKKLSKIISKILNGFSEKITLYDLNYFRDISHANDFMKGVKLIIKNEINDDFIFSSGYLTNMFDFCKNFFSLFNLDYEKYIIYSESNNYSEKYSIFGDNSKLKSIGWSPDFNIENLIIDMVTKEITNYKN